MKSDGAHPRIEHKINATEAVTWHTTKIRPSVTRDFDALVDEVTAENRQNRHAAQASARVLPPARSPRTA